MSQEKQLEKPRISQCMIVKNEEDNIERALSWGKKIVSEQIVVDTGSTDRTIEIARRMGAMVYEFPWIDDFAAAKNFAIGKATCEWIAFLDADEYFPEEEAEKLLESLGILHAEGKEGILTNYINLDDDGTIMFVGTQIRIFRNFSSIQYKGTVHESLTTVDGHSMDVADMTGELRFIHTGYGKQESSRKEGRNLRLILGELDKDPDNYAMWGYLGQEYASRNMWQEAVEAFQRSAALMPDNTKGVYGTTTSILYLRFLESLAKLMGINEGRVMELYHKCIEGWPEEPDYDYCAGRHFAGMGNWEKAEYHLRRALTLLERYGTTNRGMVLAGEIEKGYELLAICCYNNHNLEECVQLTTLLLRGNPYLMSTIVILLKAFFADNGIRKKGMSGAEKVLGFLGKSFYDFRTLKDRLFILRASMTAGYGELVEAVKGMFSVEELEAIDKAFIKY